MHRSSMLAFVLLGTSLIFHLSTSQHVDTDTVMILNPSERCPETCSLLFGMLQSTSSGERVQDVLVSQRGEAKSGTSFMFEWAEGSLKNVCGFLQELYGKRACRTVWETKETFTLSFHPHDNVVQGGPCSCQDVDRVNVSLSMRQKHALPVENECPWQHPHSVAPYRSPFAKMDDSARPGKFDELRVAMEESHCKITEDNPQMVIFRDPRAMAVSSFFFQVLHGWHTPERDGTIDEYVATMFPIFCQWIAIRYVLFEELMVAQSSVFWYSDALADPIAWHEQWFEAVGLRMPESLVKEAADDAINQRFDFRVMGRDEHPGGVEARGNRSYLEELDPETARGFDSIMETWLPPAFLDRFGLSPSD